MAITPLPSVASALPSLASAATSAASPAGGAASTFGDMVKNMVGQATAASQQAEQMTQAVAQGQNVPLNDVIQAVSKAELTLETLITVRDRAVEAYQQIQQMPI